jgi:hypothetical protein
MYVQVAMQSGKIVSHRQSGMTVNPQQQNRPCIAQKNPAPVALV